MYILFVTRQGILVMIMNTRASSENMVPNLKRALLEKISLCMTTNGRHMDKTEFFLKRTGEFAFFFV